jgi:hypothetical protein
MSSFAPPTMRSPRLTPVSDGKPWRRLLVVVKAHVVVFIDRFHVTPPGWLMVSGLVMSLVVRAGHDPPAFASEGAALPLSYRTADWSPRSESNGHALRAPASETGASACSATRGLMRGASPGA